MAQQRIKHKASESKALCRLLTRDLDFKKMNSSHLLFRPLYDNVTKGNVTNTALKNFRGTISES